MNQDQPFSNRATTILGRFPRHLDLARPGSLFGAVVDGLAAPLDRLTIELGRVRRSRRLADAEDAADLVLLAGLHGFKREMFALADERRLAIATAAEVLGDTGSTAEDRQAARDRVRGLLGLASWGGWAAVADEDLAVVLATFAGTGARLAAWRRQLGGLIQVHHRGNGTVAAILGAAAERLDLDLGPIRHADDRYWHLAPCRDRNRLPLPPGETPMSAPASQEWLALEENPTRRVETEPTPRLHGEAFELARNGFDPVLAEVRLTGMNGHTVWPMLVDLDTGEGLLYQGWVGDGDTVIFGADGQVTHRSADGTQTPANNRALALRGALLADGPLPVSGQLATACETAFTLPDGSLPAGCPGRPARFVQTRPVTDDGLNRTPPHAPGPVPAVKLLPRRTHFRVFVRAGSFGSGLGLAAKAAVDLPEAGVFDHSLFAWPGPGPARDPAASLPPAQRIAVAVSFAWAERQAHLMRLWLPSRFAALDQTGQSQLRERLRLALDRHRAAGVRLVAEYASEDWTLGEGRLSGDGELAFLAIINGTRLWPAETPS